MTARSLPRIQGASSPRMICLGPLPSRHLELSSVSLQCLSVISLVKSLPARLTAHGDVKREHALFRTCRCCGMADFASGRPQCHVFQSPGCRGAAIFAAKLAKCPLLNGLLALDRGILPLRIAIRKEKIAVLTNGIPVPAYGIVIPKNGFVVQRAGIVILQGESVLPEHGIAIPRLGFAIPNIRITRLWRS
jgi:hypothetical protein